MKMKLNVSMLTFAAATLGAMFVACSTEEDAFAPETMVINPVKAPKVIAYSGDYVFGSALTGSTRAVAASAGVTAEECKTKLIDRAHEEEIINEWLPEKNGNLKEGIDSDFLFYADKDLSLEFYPVFSQTNTQNDLGLFYYDAEGTYHEVIIWENMNPWGLTESEWKWSQEEGSYEVVTSKGIQINVPEGCAFGFYWKGNTNNGSTTYYSDSSKNVEVNCTDGNGNPLGDGITSKIHAVTFQLEGKTYLGLEDWTDFDFQDWVFTCDQELKTVDASDFVPGKTPEQTPDEGDDDGDGDDEGDDDNKDDNEIPDIVIPDPLDPGFTVDPENPKVDPNNPFDPGFTVDPEKPEHRHTNEVEVNLNGTDKGDNLESHLSIHVRAATDVEIFIPIPKQYYCEADDMEIVMKHEANHMVHGGPYELVYQLKDSDPTLTVKLTIAYEDDGIRITTDGITQEVIDWCAEKCHGDGITFEIWNYFDPEVIDFDQLKVYLNQATIKFLDKEPDSYINAFADEEDCTVSIVDEQANDYDGPEIGGHLNGSDLNEIYSKKSETEPEPEKPAKPEPPVY